MNKETRIQNEILMALSDAGFLCWRQHVGTFRSIYGGQAIQIGVTGMADIGAILPIEITQDMVGKTIGVAAQIEVKTPTGKQRDAQKFWEQAVKNRGASYIVSRSAETVVNDLKISITRSCK